LADVLRLASKKGVAAAKLGTFVRSALGTLTIGMGEGRRGTTTRPCVDCVAALSRFGVTVTFLENGQWDTKRADQFKKGECRPKKSRRREIAGYKKNQK